MFEREFQLGRIEVLKFIHRSRPVFFIKTLLLDIYLSLKRGQKGVLVPRVLPAEAAALDIDRLRVVKLEFCSFEDGVVVRVEGLEVDEFEQLALVLLLGGDGLDGLGIFGQLLRVVGLLDLLQTCVLADLEVLVHR